MTIQSTKHLQTGAALIVSLILLLVMTLIGLTAMRQNILEERMVGASMERNSAMQLTEAALRDAETWLDAQLTPPSPSAIGTPNVWVQLGPEDIMLGPVGDGQYTPFSSWTDANWAGAPLQNYGGQTGAANLPNTTNQPRYVIEQWVYNEIDEEKRKKGMGEFHYRMTAHGQGPTGNARVTLQINLPKTFK